MKIQSEFKLIESMYQVLGNSGNNKYFDDCSFFRVPTRNLLISTDTLLEDIHFRRQYSKPVKNNFQNIGYKSLAVNLSDIAASGAKPVSAVINIAIPDNLAKQDILNIYKGINELAHNSKVNIIGGDTVKSNCDKLSISITVVGNIIERKNWIRRDTAKKGDRIYLINNIGEAKVGLELLENKRHIKNVGTSYISYYIMRYLRPEPLLREAKWILMNYNVNAMIDISDGFIIDLGHIIQASNKGALIFKEKLPIPDSINYNSALNFALFGGDDYNILFTSRNKIDNKSKFNFNKATGSNIYEVGKIIEGKNIYMLDEYGKKEKIEIKGYDHFKL